MSALWLLLPSVVLLALAWLHRELAAWDEESAS